MPIDDIIDNIYHARDKTFPAYARFALITLEKSVQSHCRA